MKIFLTPQDYYQYFYLKWELACLNLPLKNTLFFQAMRLSAGYFRLGEASSRGKHIDALISAAARFLPRLLVIALQFESYSYCCKCRCYQSAAFHATSWWFVLPATPEAPACNDRPMTLIAMPGCLDYQFPITIVSRFAFLSLCLVFVLEFFCCCFFTKVAVFIRQIWAGINIQGVIGTCRNKWRE